MWGLWLITLAAISGTGLMEPWAVAFHFLIAGIYEIGMQRLTNKRIKRWERHAENSLKSRGEQ